MTMQNQVMFSKFVSELYRLGQNYFDRRLKDYRIGCGQQFFLLRVNEVPGISMHQLAAGNSFDDGTATRAVRKLETEGYVVIEPDASDRRIKRVFATESALPVIEETYRIKRDWRDIVMRDLPEDERIDADRLLCAMAGSARAYMSDLRDDHCARGTEGEGAQ